MSTRPRLTPSMLGAGAGTCLATYVFVWKLVPETNGRPPEEIQERWVVGGDRMLQEPA